MIPATYCKINAASSGLTRPSRFTSAPPSHGRLRINAAESCKISAASTGFTRLLQSASPAMLTGVDVRVGVFVAVRVGVFVKVGV